MSNSNLLECQKNSYLKQSFSKVLYCKEIPKSANFQVILEDSILYPEGGGQPFDLGFVNGFQVKKVAKPNSELLKFLIDSGIQLNPLTAVEVEIIGGSLIVNDVVKCEIDWERRYDFMQQHTAQHLFSAIAEILFDAQTVGWALGAESVSVDLESSPLLTVEQLNKLEDEINLYIRKGSKVEWKSYSKPELENNNFPLLRGGVKGAATDLDEIRLVSIEDVDLNPCGGTHLSSLSEINLLKIIGFEKDRNALRVRFLAGQRAINYFHQCLQRELQFSSKLSVPPIEHVFQIEKLLKERKENLKQIERYEEELSGYLADSLASRLPENEPPLIVHNRSNVDLKFLIKTATLILEKRSDALIFMSSEEEILPGKKVTTEEKAKQSFPFILFGEPTLVNKAKDNALSILGARGGGKPGRLQGQATNAGNISKIKDLLLSLY